MYRIRSNATPLFNRAPGNVKSPVFGIFLGYNPTFLLKSPHFEGYFKLNLTQKTQGCIRADTAESSTKPKLDPARTTKF